MSGQHRSKRLLRDRVADWIDRVTAGPIAKRLNEPLPYRPPVPVVLDHPHRLNNAGACHDPHCHYRAGAGPASASGRFRRGHEGGLPHD